MRLKGTKYEKLEGDLPKGAMTCRDFAKAKGMCSGAYVQVKYDRFTDGISKVNPGYTIKCWNGINMVIPN